MPTKCETCGSPVPHGGTCQRCGTTETQPISLVKSGPVNLAKPTAAPPMPPTPASWTTAGSPPPWLPSASTPSPLPAADHIPASGPPGSRGPLLAIVALLALLLTVSGAALAVLLVKSSESSPDTAAAGPAASVASTGPPATDTSGASDAPSQEPTEASSVDVSSEQVEPAEVSDPLAMGQPIENQTCNGGWLVMLASTGDPSAYTTTLLPVVSAVRDSHYLVTDESCSSFVQSASGNRIYAAYEGPFDSMEEACAARSSSGVADAYVRELDASVPSRDLCSCLSFGQALPVLDSSNASEPTTETQYLVTDIQVLLARAGFNPTNAIGGHYLELTTSMVGDYQASAGLGVTGTTDSNTWDGLLGSCGQPDG